MSQCLVKLLCTSMLSHYIANERGEITVVKFVKFLLDIYGRLSNNHNNYDGQIFVFRLETEVAEYE